ncbi:MAG: hydratase [Burkholderiaceae bacterium]|nr:hydratase [Burkholderiaceae bacterium]
MTPELLLSHLDAGTPWPAPSGLDLPAAYRQALAVRALRQRRGELPAGYKIGFTNRRIWDRYRVYAPIWGSVWDTTLSLCDGVGRLSLAHTCQPRLEPEAVFGLLEAPPRDASLQQLFEAIDWVAPGFEIVQSHCPDWKFTAADTVADGGLHARLLVGRRVPVREIAGDAAALERLLAAATVVLQRDGRRLETGRGANVLDGPLHALRHFVAELQACPGAPALRAGDLVTTGTWTDAWPVAPGETWQADFSAPLSPLTLHVDAVAPA